MKLTHILKLIGLLILLSVFAVAMLEIRVNKLGNTLHKGFEWNLFLAWIPLVTSLIIYSFAKTNKLHFSLFAIGFIFWLLFFPNAPYMITDLVHIRLVKAKVFPFWYDVIMIFSFAFSGLSCGLLSLYLIQQSICKYSNKILARVVIVGCIFLTSVGIYLGRILQWNSWDIFNVKKQITLFQDTITIFQKTNALTFIFIHGTMITLAYLFFILLIKIKED